MAQGSAISVILANISRHLLAIATIMTWIAMAIVRIIAIVNNRRVDKLGDLKLYMIILIMIALILSH